MAAEQPSAPTGPWRVVRGRMETCRLCGLSFAIRPGESVSTLIHRYTTWRETHEAEAESEEPHA